MRLLILDLDKTLWDHYDASQLVPPFRTHGTELIDALGNKLKLFDGVVEFLDWAKERFVLSIASWNVEKLVRPILEEFNIWHYFVFPKIENHPDKADMIVRTLQELKNSGYEIEEVIYIDDRTLHLDKIKKRTPDIRFIQMWVDVKNFEELREYLMKELEVKKNGALSGER